MFTGVTGQMAAVRDVAEDALRVSIPADYEFKAGGVIFIDGVRATIVSVVDDEIEVGITDDMRERTTLVRLVAGTSVHVDVPIVIERPINRHFVQGYVDDVGQVVQVEDGPHGRRMTIETGTSLLSRLAVVGNIAVNGVCHPVSDVLSDGFCMLLAPVILDQTCLGGLAVGDWVNLEFDLITRAGAVDEDMPARMAGSYVPGTGRLSGRVGVEQAVAQLAAGAGVVVWDPTLEGEGDVIFAGALMRPASMAFLLTPACGHTTVPGDPAVLERLEIPRMPGEGDRQGTLAHVSIDLAAATGTGVSATERTARIRQLANPAALPSDFLRPGHVFPLAARPGLLARRQGHTEVTVALCLAAGLPPVGVCCEVMRPDGLMAGVADLEKFALRWGMPMIEVADLVNWL